MNKPLNKLDEIKVILANVKTVLDTIEAGEPPSAPLQEADQDKKVMWDLLHGIKASMKGVHACLDSMASDMYGHIYNPLHIPNVKNYDHLDYACKTLGFHKEAAIRHAAYASKRVIVG